MPQALTCNATRYIRQVRCSAPLSAPLKLSGKLKKPPTKRSEEQQPRELLLAPNEDRDYFLDRWREF
jgi:hypothetical protein